MAAKENLGLSTCLNPTLEQLHSFSWPRLVARHRAPLQALQDQVSAGGDVAYEPRSNAQLIESKSLSRNSGLMSAANLT